MYFNCICAFHFLYLLSCFIGPHPCRCICRHSTTWNRRLRSWQLATSFSCQAPEVAHRFHSWTPSMKRYWHSWATEQLHSATCLTVTLLTTMKPVSECLRTQVQTYCVCCGTDMGASRHGEGAAVSNCVLWNLQNLSNAFICHFVPVWMNLIYVTYFSCYRQWLDCTNDRVVPRVIVRLHFVCVCHNWNFAITVITTCRFLA